MGYDVKFEKVDNDRHDLTFKFGEDELIHITQEQVEKLGLDHRTAFKFFALIVTNMQQSVGFKKILVKSDSFDNLMGTKKNDLDKTLEKMMDQS